MTKNKSLKKNKGLSDQTAAGCSDTTDLARAIGSILENGQICVVALIRFAEVHLQNAKVKLEPLNCFNEPVKCSEIWAQKDEGWN